MMYQGSNLTDPKAAAGRALRGVGVMLTRPPAPSPCVRDTVTRILGEARHRYPAISHRDTRATSTISAGVCAPRAELMISAMKPGATASSAAGLRRWCAIGLTASTGAPRRWQSAVTPSSRQRSTACRSISRMSAAKGLITKNCWPRPGIHRVSFINARSGEGGPKVTQP